MRARVLQVAATKQFYATLAKRQDPMWSFTTHNAAAEAEHPLATMRVYIWVVCAMCDTVECVMVGERERKRDTRKNNWMICSGAYC